MYDPLRAKAKIAVYTAVAFVFGMGLASGLGWTDASIAMPVVSETAQVSEAAVKPAMDLSDAFVNLAEVVTPAVVRIETRRPVSVSEREVPEAFRRFFDVPEGDPGQPPPQGELAGGSGFIVSPDGVILTNNHVIAGADEVRVYLADRRYYVAEVIGTDPFTDVAVIRIDAGEELPAMSFGNSEEVRVGEWILAIGNPGFGASTQLDYTVTAGIVSARGRGLQLLQRDLFNDPDFGPDVSGFAIEDFLQTDAVINPGNSGGPMVDLRGRVIGINSAIASSTGYYQGYGFAIPINLARRIMEDLVEFGHVRRPLMGVDIAEVAPEDADLYGLPKVSGVLIQGIREGGPSVGQLRPEDVIVSLDGNPIGYVAELQAKIAERRPGDRVTLTVYRDKRPTEVTIRLDEAPINDRPVRTADRTVLAEERLGISVESLTPAVAQELGYAQPGGVVITNVVRASPAARRGLGQFVSWKLVQVNDTRIASPQDVGQALAATQPGAIVSLHLADNEGGERVVNVRMP